MNAAWRVRGQSVTAMVEAALDGKRRLPRIAMALRFV
jgi:hypothetical protein